MKKKLPYLLPSFVFFLGAPIVWILCFREVPLRISPETTYITEPKTADGKSIDYFAAIKDRFEPKCKPEENGFRMVAAALGKSPFFDQHDGAWAALCKELDLDPNLAPTLKYEDPHQFVNREYLLWLDENEPVAPSGTVESKPGEPTDSRKLQLRLLMEPWTGEEYPFMVRWIEENSPMLDLLVKASRSEHFFCPWIRPPEMEGTMNFVGTQSDTSVLLLIMGLGYRGNYRLGIGDVDGAWSDATAMTRLSVKHNKNLSTILSIGTLLNLETNILRLHPVSEANRARYLSDLDGLAPLFSFEKYVRSNRLVNLWFVSNFARYPEPNMKYINWCRVAYMINKDYDEFDRIAEKIQEPNQADDIDTMLSPYALPPKRSFLSERIGKPLTVEDRSRELAYMLRTTLGWPGSQYRKLKKHQDRYDELRTLLEASKASCDLRSQGVNE